MEVVKGLGHCFCVEDTESIAELIRAFVEEGDSGRLS